MRKNYFNSLFLSATFALILGGNTFGQDQHDHLNCGQGAALKKMQEEHPEVYQNYLQNVELSKKNPVNTEKNGTIYRIPVVFHILHNNGSENITDEQVYDAFDILNRDFRKLNNDVENVVAQFLPIAADVEIEFLLARTAPDGSCFNGITRTQSSATAIQDGSQQVEAVIAGNDVYNGVWPHNRYLNIYITRELIDGAAGYTFMPGTSNSLTSTGMYYNGIFMLHQYVGRIGTGSEYGSRALTHEVGHWLGLHHTWGPGELGVGCDTDEVNDTPVTGGSTSCNLAENSCGPLANVENYMDYSYCSKMFTEGQKARMRDVIVGFTSGRNNIHTTANLELVGAVSSNSVCSADIQSNVKGVCAGSSATYSVNNTTANITSYSWTFQGGTPATSTSASPTVTYATPGVYNVQVVLNAGSNSKTIVKNEYFVVNATAATTSIPFAEGFVSTTFPPEGWTLSNGGTQSSRWRRSSTRGVAPTAGNSMVLNLTSGSNEGDVEMMTSPVYNYGSIPNGVLSFDLAYRQLRASTNDKLEVQISNGCNQNFQTVYVKSGADLATTEMNSQVLATPTESQWRKEEINLTPFIADGKGQVRFKATSARGNFMYVDNISLQAGTGSLSVENLNAEALTLFPNPVDGSFRINGAAVKQVQIIDLLGKEVRTFTEGQELYDVSDLRNGAYMVRVVTENGTSIVKIQVK